MVAMSELECGIDVSRQAAAGPAWGSRRCRALKLAGVPGRGGDAQARLGERAQRRGDRSPSQDAQGASCGCRAVLCYCLLAAFAETPSEFLYFLF